ncbi:MAG TPA: 4-(cytidine 5'-diphospho)-2-C-methyl-D-erythritol kinase [Chloroflexia bacterium]|nr:4-(cytidine 5'-diphospho)-2-C-methyl-D-erythritol kinase [Chloroflexia bacterium]
MTDPAFEMTAPAKINLTLEILGRRKDGYHNLTSVMQTITLADTLLFAPRADGQIVVDCADPGLARSPQDNLVWRAARLLQQARSVPLGAQITLTKGIPVAAGLGGGSSDAAATLRGLDRLWGLGLSGGEMHNVAGLLGSDVPFFLHGGTSLIEGRGEQVTPLRPIVGGWIVLVTPPLLVPGKTAVVYGLLRPHEYSTGVLTRRLVAALAAGQPLATTMLYNGMEDAVFRAFDTLDAVRQQISGAGGDGVRVTGAGPSLYVYYDQEADACRLYEALQAAGLPVHLVQPQPPLIS